jgi:glutamyl-tRNA reductase
MSLVVVGANHRTAPIELRERLAFGRAEVPEALARVRESTQAAESVLLSTCNRTEIYLTLPEEGHGVEVIRRHLAERVGLSEERIAASLYVHRDRAAATHLFRVAAGLDSMVLGEPQIQGQVREAYPPRGRS